ncbi:putative membrane-associated protein [Trypanosoma theileri]|uniref:Putative membrane-associated protein n=1 Tax=Trypanosoma theileri TaxID=67003 RepID=A0A1X0P1S2_9TRYP|nr:putative membrane-associated protein [Trypanosoma theileri]ORC90459.1 putative membrane-associated protein [Trypanosoma theileri]
MSRSLLLVLLFLFCCGGALVVDANIHLRVVNDTRRVIYIGSFAFGPQGAVRLETRKFAAPAEMYTTENAKAPVLMPTAPVGFILIPVESVSAARMYARYGRGEVGTPLHVDIGNGYASRVCFIKDPLLGLQEEKQNRMLFPFEGLSSEDILKMPSTYSADRIGLYAVYFYNCADMPDNGEPVHLRTLPLRPISFDIYFELYWMNGEHNRVYLSYGREGLPNMFTFFGVVFLIMALLWILQVFREWINVKKIHLLMLLLVVIKMGTLFIESMKLQHFSKTGKVSMWDFFFYITVTLKGVMLFGVILLLGVGWSLLRDHLSSTDKRILLVVLPCQVMLNVCWAIIEETSEGNRNWSTWLDILQILDVICCCCVLFPLILTIKKIREAGSTDESTARTVTRMREFRTFYIVVVAYIYITRIVLIMVANAVSYDKAWIAEAGAQMVAVLFYIFCGYRFRPKIRIAATPYSILQPVEVMVVDAELKDCELSSRNSKSTSSFMKS